MTVPERAPPVGEIRARWAWVEAEVWTERMLAIQPTRLVLLKTSLPCGSPIFLKANHQLESRMREIRQSGSEGGAT
jgi:hypothetical protein